MGSLLKTHRSLAQREQSARATAASEQGVYEQHSTFNVFFCLKRVSTRHRGAADTFALYHLQLQAQSMRIHAGADHNCGAAPVQYVYGTLFPGKENEDSTEYPELLRVDGFDTEHNRIQTRCWK